MYSPSMLIMNISIIFTHTSFLSKEWAEFGHLVSTKKQDRIVKCGCAYKPLLERKKSPFIE